MSYAVGQNGILEEYYSQLVLKKKYALKSNSIIPTFQNSCECLDFITKKSEGVYYINPKVFWRGELEERERLIECR